MAYFRKRATLSLLLMENMVVWLVLETMRFQRGTEVFAEELHALPLVGITMEAHPNKMNVILHEAIGRTNQTLAHGRVQHDFPESRVKGSREPAGATKRDGHCPVDGGVALVVLPRQAREIKTSIQSFAVEMWVKWLHRLGIHEEILSNGPDQAKIFFPVASGVSRIIFWLLRRGLFREKGNVGAGSRRAAT